MDAGRLVALVGVQALATSRIGVEPYLVQCNSCQSKIRVRNPNLIGKRVNCPKCAAEILITPPAAPKIHVASADQPSVDSTAMTKDGFAEDALSGLGSLNAQSDYAGSNEPLGAFSNFDFSEVDQVLIQQAQQASAEQTMQNYADPESPALGSNDAWQAPQRAAPTDQWSSKSAAKSRQMLIVGFLGASSCLVAALAFYLFLRWYNAGPTVADKPAVVPNQIEGATNNPSIEAPNNGNQDGNPPEPNDAQVDASNEPVSQTETNTDQPKIVVDANSNSNPPNANSNNSTPIQPNNSTNNDPSKPGTESKGNDDGSQPPAIVNPDTPPRLLELLKVIGEPITLSEPPKIIVPEKPAVTDLEIQSGARELKMTPVAKLTEAASQRRIWKLTITQRKLHDVVSIWNSTVGLPVAVSTLSLAAADYDSSQLFDIELQDVNATTGIEQLANALGLKVENRENRFWLLYAASPSEDKLPTKLKVDDLVTDQVQQQWLKETIELIFPGTSGSMTIEDGNLSAKAEQIDRITWFSIARMLENWRTQLGLPAQLSGYRKANIDVPFVTASKLPQLDTTLNQVNSTAKPLAQLINQQCNAAGLASLIDWPALEYLPVRMSGGEMKAISPQSPRVSVTFSRPLKNFLKELEFELGIFTLLLDDKTMIMTSRFAYRRMPQVFVIPSEGKSVDGYWDQYFRPLTPIDSAGISNVVIRPTPDGKHLIVKSCWPTLQFE